MSGRQEGRQRAVERADRERGRALRYGMPVARLQAGGQAGVRAGGRAGRQAPPAILLVQPPFCGFPPPTSRSRLQERRRGVLGHQQTNGLQQTN